MLRSLVRQLIHVWRQSMRLLVEFLALLVFDTTPSTSCVCHPSVAGCGMDLADDFRNGFWENFTRRSSSWLSRILRNAWFDTGYMPFGTLQCACPQLQLRSSMWCRSQSL